MRDKIIYRKDLVALSMCARKSALHVQELVISHRNEIMLSFEVINMVEKHTLADHVQLSHSKQAMQRYPF